MWIRFYAPLMAPAHAAFDVELVFEPGEPLEGLRLAGLAACQALDGTLYVSFPPRRCRDGRRFRYLRGAVPGPSVAAHALKQQILAEFRRQKGLSAPAGG